MLGDATFDRGDLFVEQYGSARRFTGVWLKDAQGLDLWWNAATRVVLIAEHYGELVIRVALDEPAETAASVACDLKREAGENLGGEFVETASGPVYAFENAVAAFNPDGRLRWTARHRWAEWLFRGVDGDVVRFAHSYHERTRDHRLDDGRMTERPS